MLVYYCVKHLVYYLNISTYRSNANLTINHQLFHTFSFHEIVEPDPNLTRINPSLLRSFVNFCQLTFELSPEPFPFWKVISLGRTWLKCICLFLGKGLWEPSGWYSSFRSTAKKGERWDVPQFLFQQFIWFCSTIQEWVVLATCFST